MGRTPYLGGTLPPKSVERAAISEAIAPPPVDRFRPGQGTVQAGPGRVEEQPRLPDWHRGTTGCPPISSTRSRSFPVASSVALS